MCHTEMVAKQRQLQQEQERMKKKVEKKRGRHDWSFNVIFKSLTTCSGNGWFGLVGGGG